MNNEYAIVSQLKADSYLAFTYLYEQYSHDAYILAFKYLGNKELAEDAVQDLFLKLWNIRKEINAQKPINRLLFTMLRNNLLNILRDCRRNRTILDNCLENLNTIDDTDDEIQQIAQYQIELLERAVAQLPPQRKAIFNMKLTGKYSNLEIASSMNLSVNTIKFQYSQALKQIKSFIQHHTPDL